MALVDSRLRPCLLAGVGLTVLVVCLFLSRYYVPHWTTYRLGPRRASSNILSTAAAARTRTAIMEPANDLRLNPALPATVKQKDWLSNKAGYVGQTKRARKKGRIVRPAHIRQHAKNEDKGLLHSLPLRKSEVGRQVYAEALLQRKGHKLQIRADDEQSNTRDMLQRIAAYDDSQEVECPSTTLAPPLDVKQLDPCGPWIRTCHRECICSENGPKQIPRVVHFIKDGNLTFSDWLAITAAKKYIKPTRINLFTRNDVAPSCWMRRLKLLHNVDIIGLTSKQWLDKLNNVLVSRVEHQSDLLRNALLYHYGGIYMDTDAIATRSFDPLLSNHSIVLGQNLVNLTGNGLIVARRQSCLICDYASLACDAFDGSWRKHSTVSLSKLIKMNKAKYNLLLLSNTSGFFPFSWREEHFHQLFDISSTSVSFSTNQVYALHLFGSKFPKEIVNRFNNLTWINESPSILASHLRTLVHSQFLSPNHLSEALCINLPSNFLK